MVCCGPSSPSFGILTCSPSPATTGVANLDEQRFPVETKFYDTEPGVQVLVHSQAPAGEPVAQLILVHGLEGSSAAGYARSLAQAALEAGCATHRFNMRSCGGTEHLSGRTLYHSGQTSDLLAVIRQLPHAAPIFLAGFSLGGNVVLKLAGELGESASDLIAGVMAISTPIDLAACVRQLDKPSNIIYARRFVTRLKERVRAKERLTPGLFDLSGLEQVRNIYDFDDRFTAQAFGFGSADNYYATQSSNQFLDRIRVPTLAGAGQGRSADPLRRLRSPGILAPILTCACWPSSTAATSASSRKPSRASGWIRFSYTGYWKYGTR